ncbi:MAG: GNAT family N-acetyltransferase [Lachnospiraceae bacterium]|nr:GNAT family N-acetyltransferase [Lachnospiraceae bacterium]
MIAASPEELASLKEEGLLPSDFQPLEDRQLVLKAVSENDIAGVLCVADRGAALEIVSIVVKQEYRRLGIATKMLGSFFSSCYLAGELKPVYCFYIREDWLAGFDAFVRDSGYFFTEASQTLYAADPSRRMRSPGYRKLISEAGGSCELWAELPPETKKRFLKKRAAAGDHLLQGLDEAALDEDLCFCIRGRDGEIKAAAFVQKTNEARYALSYVYSSDPVSFEAVLGTTLKTFDVLCEDSVMEAVPVDARVERIIQKLVGSGSYKSWWEADRNKEKS